MNVKCPDCNTIVSIDESQYKTGEVGQTFCPRCGATVSATIEHGGQDDLPVKGQPSSQSVQYANPTEVSHPSTNMDHELKKAELALKAKELEIREKEMQHQNNQPVQQTVHQHYYVPSGSNEPISYPKSKTTAGLLGIFLGALGAHKFYLGKTGMGILYLVFCWTYIPGIIGLVEGIIYLTKSDADFHRDYVAK